MLSAAVVVGVVAEGVVVGEEEDEQRPATTSGAIS